MDRVSEVLDRLIEYLEMRTDALEIDNYNEYTREWSAGFRKGAQWLLRLVKYFKNTLEG